MTYRDHLSTDTLADHAEGLLGESENVAVDAHLAECDDCRATALLLASIPEILAADSVGPMPAHFASRIDATLADLYTSEPPIARPEPAAATPVLAKTTSLASNVVDLASRRKLALTGLRRVSTIAASMVLLIAGAALGIQSVGKDKDFVDPSANNIGAVPVFTNQPSPYTGKLTAPKNAVKGQNGSKRDPKTGVVFLKNGRILLPNGDVVVPSKNGGPYTVLTPKTNPAPAPPAPAAPAAKPPAQPPQAEPPKAEPPTKVDPNATIVRGEQPKTAQETRPGAAAATTAPAPTEDPAGLSRPAPEPATPEQQPKAARANTGDKLVASDDPYVSESGRAYTEENFAALVMDLAQAARRHGSASGDFEPSSTTPAPTPSAPAPSAPSGYRMPTSLRIALSQWNLPQNTGRGPAVDKFEDRVKRCAAQLGTQAFAGDRGVWQDKEATIVITPSDNPNQMNGYVFYGDCPAGAKVTAQSAQWEQRVDKPAPDPNPQPSPVKRTGSVQPSNSESRSRTQ